MLTFIHNSKSKAAAVPAAMVALTILVIGAGQNLARAQSEVADRGGDGVQEATTSEASVLSGTIRLDKALRLKDTDLDDVVVWVEGGSIAPTELAAIVASLPPAACDQQDMQFRPRVLPVVVGQTVTFPNNDVVFHSVTSMSEARKFDLGIYGPGQSKDLVFDAPGVVHLRCAVHSEMEGFLVIVPTPFFTKPKRDGSFQIIGVPQGVYTLHVWHPASQPLEAPIEVKDGAQVALSEFVLQPQDR